MIVKSKTKYIKENFKKMKNMERWKKKMSNGVVKLAES